MRLKDLEIRLLCLGLGELTIKGDKMSKPNYGLLKNAYYGTGGFEDGGYLIKHPREADDKYNKRKEISYYLNYVSAVVDGHVNPIFRAPIKRDWKNSSLSEFELFIEDVDCSGTAIDSFMKMAALSAKLYGIVFIVVDNFQELPATKDKTLKERKFPYLYLVNPESVKEYKLDRLGRLTEFSFAEKVGEAEQTRTLTTEGWSIEGEGSSNGAHSLGVVPVVPLLSRKVKLTEDLPPSEFTAISRTNMNIFQQCSWLNEILQNQTFPLLIYPSKEATKLIIGSENALGFDGEKSQHAPNFIAPPSGPSEAIASNIDRLIKEIYRMAQMSHATGVQTQLSGTAKAWDFEENNMALSDFAENLENAEMRIGKIFSLYCNSAEFNYSCVYSRDFKVPDIKGELEIAQAAIDLNFGELFNTEVLKRVLEVMFPGLESESYDAIVASLAKALEDESHTKRADEQDEDDPEGIEE